MKNYKYPEYNQKYRIEHRQKLRAQSLEYYYANKERLLPIHRAYAKKYRKHIYEYRQQVKVEVLTHYGKGILACVICGEKRLACLSIDHINGGGGKHTKEIGGGGIYLYFWLRHNEFPKGYQTLCMNCQWVKRVENNEMKRNAWNE